MSALSVQMEAYAFRQLIAHLQWRADVQNIDIMNLAGFCRNCLSKWYLAGAKVYGVPLDYDQACERVYGEPYAEWKKRHQKKASEEQVSMFEASKAKHARTDPGPALAPMLLVPTAQNPTQNDVAVPPAAAASAVLPRPAYGHSNVCGQDCDDVPPPAALDATGSAVEARIAVVTCSDRASQGIYADESGPAVKASIRAFAERSGALRATFCLEKVVPDDELTIAGLLKEWSELRACDVIFTTGGTGMGPRDVTPEASKRVIARFADGLARAMAWQTSFHEPHSVLSRGVCGVTAQGVLVVNLPGNPAAVRQCLSVLLPVLPQAIRMLKS